MNGKKAILKLLGSYEQFLLDLFPVKQAIVAINVESGRFVSLLDQEEIAMIETAISQLSPQREKVVRMLFGIGAEKVTVKEAARILKLDEGTIHSTKEVGFDRLRRDHRELEKLAISCLTQKGFAKKLESLKKEQIFLKQVLAELVAEKTKAQN